MRHANGIYNKERIDENSSKTVSQWKNQPVRQMRRRTERTKGNVHPYVQRVSPLVKRGCVMEYLTSLGILAALGWMVWESVQNDRMVREFDQRNGESQ